MIANILFVLLFQLNGGNIEQVPRDIVLVITDTIVTEGDRKAGYFAVNGKFPPDMVSALPKENVSIRFINKTRSAIFLELPGKMISDNEGKVVENILKDASHGVKINTSLNVVFNYHIYRFEQEGPGTIGSVVIQQQPQKKS